ncbi:MAG: thioredoxin fold domain-containing protein [bacterium]
MCYFRIARAAGWCMLLALGLCLGFSSAKAQQIHWIGYEEALREAERTGRPILLYFFVKDCQYCQKMESKTLVASRVAEYLREEFISSRVDGDKSPQLTRRYMVRGFPTIWFLSPEGKPISSLPGYVEPEELTKVLRYIRGGHYRSKSLREYLSGS